MRNFFKVMVLCLYLSNNSYLKADDESQKALAIFKNNCSRCHKGAGSAGGDFNVLDSSTMTVGKNGEKPYIIPGNPDESYLLSRIIKKSMPPKDVAVRPSDEDVKIITEWIKKGAKPFVNNEEKRTYISWLDILTSVRNDLRNRDLEDIKYTRYFSLVNLSNNQKTTSEDLRLYRAALSKALNSLSWRRNIVLPRPIDENHLIFAIDVRKLDWDINSVKVWQTMTNYYPYGLSFDSKESEEADKFYKIQDEICKLTHCKIPIVRADWFVSNATKPPIYHNILSIPFTAGELEKKVGVDVYTNLERNEVYRAGFQQSGISGQNRLVERHNSLYGAYWKSYDFLPKNDYSLLTTYPLGPKYERNPYQKQAFEHDGGEIIFNLPNGLQAYMLVDGKDKRIDNGPIDVVNDTNKFSGTSVIANGISCMGCHKNGMRELTHDNIREGHGLTGVLAVKVRSLYPKPEKMTEAIKIDERLFLTSLREAVLPYVPEFAEDLRKLKEMPEPITKLVIAHRDDALTLEHVAAELDFKNSDQLKIIINGNDKLKKLRPLCQPGGSIKRAEWEKYETTIEGSLFQICANALGKGKPYTLDD